MVTLFVGMAAIGLIAGLVGLLAAAAGVFFMLYAFGVFDYMGGNENNPNAVSRDTLFARLTALNDPDKPFQIRQGEDTDIIAEWKIADARWYGVFNKSGLSKSYRINMLLDESRHSVRCFEELGSLQWTAGTNGLTPAIHYQNSFFSGRVLFKKEWGVGYGIKDPKTLEAGKVYEYKFDIDEIRNPLIAVVRANGWEWVPVTTRRNVISQI